MIRVFGVTLTEAVIPMPSHTITTVWSWCTEPTARARCQRHGRYRKETLDCILSRISLSSATKSIFCKVHGIEGPGNGGVMHGSGEEGCEQAGAGSQVVAAAGAVDHDQLVSLSEKAFSGLSTDPTTAYDLAQKVRRLPARACQAKCPHTESVHVCRLGGGGGGAGVSSCLSKDGCCPCLFVSSPTQTNEDYGAVRFIPVDSRKHRLDTMEQIVCTEMFACARPGAHG